MTFRDANESTAIGNTTGQLIAAVEALRLINDEIEKNLGHWPHAASLLASAGLRLAWSLPRSPERSRFVGLVRRSGVAGVEHRDMVERLVAMALQGRKPCVVEACKVCLRPRIH